MSVSKGNEEEVEQRAWRDGERKNEQMGNKGERMSRWDAGGVKY